jgi:deazaflavin-dependent oxidoreductase (nitroreductase family)
VIVDPIGEELAAWGKVLMIETRGRVTGRPARAALGFVEERDGTWLVTSGSPDADWARNLESDPDATLEVGGRRVAVVAEPLDDADHARAVRELILRYGTPAERLGAGTSFRLRPVATIEPPG